jgi:hypothetical protein
MRRGFELRLRQCAAYFLLWTVPGLFMFSQGMVQKAFSHDPDPWWHYLTSWMVGVYLWCLLTPVILWLGRRFPFERAHWIRSTITHLSSGMVIALLALTIESFILHLIGVFPAIMTSFAATLVVLLVMRCTPYLVQRLS